MADDSLDVMQANQAYQATLPSQQQPQAAPPAGQAPQQAIPTLGRRPSMQFDPNAPQLSLADPAAAVAAQPQSIIDAVVNPQVSAGGGMRFADYMKTIGDATIGVGSDLLGAASWTARQMGANPSVIQHIEGARSTLENVIENSVSSMTPDGQKALHASIFGGDTGPDGEHIPTPGEVGWGRYLAVTAAGMFPDVLTAIAAPEVAGESALRLLGEVGPKVAAAVKGAVTGAAFGTLQLGDTYEQFVKDVDQSKPEDWAKSPAMQHMLQQGVSFTDAKKNIVGQAATQLGAMQFGLGAITGAGAGQILMRGPLASAGRGLLARIGLGVGEGSVTLGTQTGGSDAIQQRTEMATGLTQNFDSSRLARAIASGVITGGAMGAVGGALHTGVEANPATSTQPQETAEAGPSTSLIHSDVAAALNTQLDLPLDQASPGFVGSNQQGELFRSTDQANEVPRTGAAPAGGGPGPGGASVQPATQPTATPQAPAAGPRPSDGMKRQEILDAMSTMPGQDPRQLRRMTRGDLASRFDQLPQTGTPEPGNGVAAQVSAVANPGNPKDAAFFANGTPVPDNLPHGVTRVDRPEGTLVTTDAQKAATFQQAGQLDDTTMAGLLGSAEASGSPTVVNGTSPESAPAADNAGLTPIDKAANNAEEPTPAQAEAGNYQKGHTNIGGLDVSIETPKGGVRRGVGPDGTPWEATMPDHYGYIKRTTGADGDHVDVTLGPLAHEAAQHEVFVVDQRDPATGKFDEHKAFIGYSNPADALSAYDRSFSDQSGPGRRGALNPMSFDDFKRWVREGDTTKAISYKPTPREMLNARRAQQKAQMAKPGAPMRGTVATVEPPEGRAQTSDIEPRTYGETVHALHEAIGKAEIIPLKKGADVSRVMNQVMRELSDRLSGAKTEGDIHEVVSKWARSNPDPLPGTRTRRIQIGDQIMQLLTNKSVDEFSGRAARVAGEARLETRQPSVYESEGAARQADLEAAHAREQDVENETRSASEGTSEGVQAVEGNETPEPQKIVDKLPWWLDRVRQGQMTVQEADAAYGSEKPGVGRKRTYRTFSDYLEAMAQRAEDPDVAASLRKRLAFADRTMAGQRLSAETVRVNKLLDTTGTDAATELRKLKADLDPVHAAVDTAPPKRAADVLRERLAARRALGRLGTDNTFARVMAAPETNRVVDDMLNEGRPRSVHDYLQAIADDPAVNQNAPAMASLARRLRTLVGNDVEVTPAQDRVTSNGDAGTFWQNPRRGTGQIELASQAPNSRVETLLHEALHSVTSHYLDSLPDDHPDMRMMKAIGDELRSAAEQNIGSMTPTEVEELQYALSNVHELHTMLMSNPAVQQIAADHTPSMRFRSVMRTLGQPLQMAKSVWAAFTGLVRRAIGLKGMVRPEDARLLDHVMRPMQDIAERAAAYNREGGDANLEDVASHAMPNFGDTRRAVMDQVDPAGLGDRARRAALMASTTDGIVKWNRDLFAGAAGNSLERYRTATEGVAARNTAFHNKYADRVSALIDKIQGPERDKVAGLMNNATLANVRLGADADNSHLTTDAQREQLKQLQAQYRSLTPGARETYNAARDYYADTYREERDAQIKGLIKTVLPDVTGEQRDAIVKAARTRAGIDSMLNDDTSPVAKAFGDAWGSNRALVRGIGQIHALGFVQGDYFPLRRFGDYVVRYGSHENEDYGVEMFERRSEAEARRGELLRQGADDVSQVMDKATSKLRDMLPNTTVVDQLNDAMRGRPELRDHADEVRDLVNSILMQSATHSERARQSMRRRSVQGASTDVERVLARDFLSTSSRIGYMENGPERYAALADMRRHVDDLGRTGQAGEQIRAQAVLHELEQRMPSGDDASGALTGLARRFSTLGFVQSLMSPSHMITSSIEAHMNSTALLGARHGGIKATVALTKALKDVSPVLAMGARKTLDAVRGQLKAADWNLSTVARDRFIKAGADKAAMTDLFNRLNAAGLVDHTMVREMQRIANPRSDITKGWWGRFMDMNAAGAHAVDVANKSAIAKAAYDLEMRKTSNHDAAARYAVDTARSAMPNYNLANKARIATDKGPLGGFAGPLTQFKQYGIHMYSVMANLVKASVHGASPGERMEARKAFAGILATHAMMAGTLTLLGDGLRWIGGAYDFATGADKPHDYENDVRRWMTGAFGPELGEIVARGLPHAVGVDIHRRVGLANLLEPPELNSFDKVGFAEAAASAMTGAAGEDATVMAGGLSKILHGDITGGLKDMVPRVIRDPMKAVALADKGVTDSRGKTLLPPSKISAGDIAAQAAGFQPARVSEFREGRNAVMEARDEAKTQGTKLRSAWLAADPDDRAEIMTRIRQFNQANPGQAVTLTQLLQAKERQRKEAAQLQLGTFGLTLPKGARSRLSGAGDFANVGS